MALETSDYVVSRDVALRTGEIENHYRTADGRFILDSRTLSLIRFRPDEYINGLSGVEKITHDEALSLIAQGGYHLGDKDNNEEKVEETEQTPDEEKIVEVKKGKSKK